MDELVSVFVRTGAEFLDLLQYESPAAGLVLDLVETVDDDEEVGLFLASGRKELLRGEREVVLRGYDEDNDVNLFLVGEECSSLQRVTVETGRIDEGNVDDAVVKK